MTVQGTGKDLVGLKSRIVGAVSKAEGVLAEPVPEVLVVGLGDPNSHTIKICVTWWTRPRQHEMITTYDHVLSAMTKTLADGAPLHAEPSRAA